MRFLKNKIIKAREATEKRLQTLQETSSGPFSGTSMKLEDESQSGSLWNREPKIEESEYSHQTRSTFAIDFVKTEELDQIISSPSSAQLSQLDEKILLKVEKSEDTTSFCYSQNENYSVKQENLSSDCSMVKSEFNQFALPKKEKIPEKKNQSNQPKKYVKNVDLTCIKAIITFANSHTALPYIKVCLQQENLKFTDLISFITLTKERITNGVQSFWSLFLDDCCHDPKTEACKRIFQNLSQVFIDNFSVEWIMQSKLVHKDAYLKYRQKMLKKIQNPGHYIQASKKNSPNVKSSYS